MKIKEIRKRDGRIVAFDETKIAEAIFKAAQAVGGKDYELSKRLAAEVVKRVEKVIAPRVIPTVEEVQDAVEKTLIENGHAKTAKAYILYRDQRTKVREFKSLVQDINVIEDYLNEEDWRVKENSNMTFSLQGLDYYISSRLISYYWLEKIYPPEIRNAHVQGDFHIHDLGTLGAYCVGWDLLDILLNGFRGVSGKIETNPPKHLRSALGQVVNFFYTLQGESAGAQALSNFDTYLAPFIRYGNLNYKEVKQALQEFVFNMNVPTRVGFQTPFTNITLDIIVPEFMKNEPVIIGGKPMEETYGDFQEEMKIFNRAFAEVMMEGDAKGRPFTFPIPTICVTEDFDWTNTEDKIWGMTAKYGIPYFSNFINSGMKPEDVRSMCCRLRIDKRNLNKRGGGLFGANPLTGSIGVVTINMPRIGFISESEEDFFKHLDHLLLLAKESLEIKRKAIERFTELGLYPYSKFYLRKVKDSEGMYWENHFSTIGIVGVNEAALNLKKKSIAEPEGREFALKILDFIRNRIQGFQQETGHIYNLEATPAEGTSYRLALIDKKMYPNIIVANEEQYKNGAAPFYTNSTQLPVNYTDDIFEALELQDEIQTKYTGGIVFHGFLGENMPSIEATKMLVKKIAENFHIPYFTITPTYSICPNHGYISGRHDVCPRCSDGGKEVECEVYSRIVGYIRPVKQWNSGKRSEFELRKTFSVVKA
jgi:ribonucleoside-triphosphate reductase